jgi:hypothetical protein
MRRAAIRRSKRAQELPNRSIGRLLDRPEKGAAMTKLYVLTLVSTCALLLGSVASAQPLQCSNNPTGYQTCYGPGGQLYQSQQDKFGNTTTYGPGGQLYQSQRDKFGNTTTYGPNGQMTRCSRDKFGNTTCY